ncbi:MAG TPA: hypothetical protein VFI31_12985 [Pirellulales bacterium]|nr:hypothetical protein [Pirellulales bacterium]
MATSNRPKTRPYSTAPLASVFVLAIVLVVQPAPFWCTLRTLLAAAPMPRAASEAKKGTIQAFPGVAGQIAATDPKLPPNPKIPAGSKTASRPASGIVFRGRPAEIAQVRLRMREWLAALKCPSQLVSEIESASHEEVAFTLNTPPGDTDTLTLRARLPWAMPVETVAFQDRDDVSQTRELASEAEIVAAMLQRGRAFLFAGAHCSLEQLKEHVAIRRNIAYWGSRADWIFPDPFVPRFNSSLWDALQVGEWTLQPGVSARRAIADAFEGRPAYELGCKSACQFVMAHGIFDYFATLPRDAARLARLEERLDPVHPLREIEAKADKQGVIRRPGRLLDRHFNVAWNHWVPGDWGWIKNTDDPSSNEACAEGSNIIYAGGGRFVNYYAGGPIRTLDESLKRVYGWRFGLENGELDLPDDVMQRLRGDPRAGGLLRNVRDVPQHFELGAPSTRPEA